MGDWRLRLANSARLGKTLLGAAMIVIAVSIASGIDKKIEARLVEISPAWLTDFTTKY